MIRKFTPRRALFEAVRWDGKPETAELIETWSFYTIRCDVNKYDHTFSRLTIENREGAVFATVGDYIVRTGWGQFTSMSAKQFAEAYEPIR